MNSVSEPRSFAARWARSLAGTPLRLFGAILITAIVALVSQFYPERLMFGPLYLGSWAIMNLIALGWALRHH